MGDDFHKKEAAQLAKDRIAYLEERGLTKEAQLARELLAAGQPVAVEGSAEWVRGEMIRIAREDAARQEELLQQIEEIKLNAKPLLMKMLREKDTDKKAKLKQRYKTAMAEQNTLVEQQMATGQKSTLRQFLYVDNPAQINPNITGGFSGSDAAYIETGIAEFSKMVGTGTMDNIPVEISKTDGRAYQLSGDVWIAAGDREKVTIHELGHVLERGDTVVRLKAVRFLERRTAGESLTPLGGDYDPSEMTKRDKFIDPYMGKYYRDNYATEIISAGLEYMWNDPAQFAEDDPDYFDFMYNTLRGE